MCHSALRTSHRVVLNSKLRNPKFEMSMIPHSEFRIPHWDDSALKASQVNLGDNVRELWYL